MIISQTPYRVSFAGGGTDLREFYEREYGAVLNAAIGHFMYVTVHERFEPNIRISYSKTEICAGIDDIEHEIVRETLRRIELRMPLEITTIGDVPAGTGLGSSSALTVGLLNALHAFRGNSLSASCIADEACEIEVNILKNPIGKQDQYASAYGGINYIRFNPDGSVDVQPVQLSVPRLMELESRLMLVYTNGTRAAKSVLEHQYAKTKDHIQILRQMRDLSGEMAKALGTDVGLDDFAQLLHEGWALKRSLGFGISNQRIDSWYEKARRAGAQGGKLLGAGGSGFLLLMAPREKHQAIRAALGKPSELEFTLCHRGTRIIFSNGRNTPLYCADPSC